MANSCSFYMKIAGQKEGVEEFIQMLGRSEAFPETGFNLVDDLDVSIPEDGPLGTNQIAITCQGNCDWSILYSMRDYRDRHPSLESETKRLGLVVEAYSMECGSRFQEHVLISGGEVLIEETEDYEEHYIPGMTEYGKQKLCEDLNMTMEEMMKQVNSDGDLCIGGFESYGYFEDLFMYLKKENIKEIASAIKGLDGRIQDAAARTSAPPKAEKEIFEKNR